MSMYQEIPLNQLVFSADNVRVINASKAADNELIAGIRSSGLLQNLIVKPNKKKFEVIAGARRLAALNYLEKYIGHPHTWENILDTHTLYNSKTTID